MEIPAHLRNEQVNIGWCTVLLQTVSKTPPASAMPEDEFDREKHHWWKAKKWAYSSLNLLFIRYVRLDTGVLYSLSVMAMPKLTYLQARKPFEPRKGRRAVGLC